MDIYFNLTIMLSSDSELIRMFGDLFRININGELYAWLRWCLLFNFRCLNAQFNGPISEFWYNVMTTNVRVGFCRMATCFFNM